MAEYAAYGTELQIGTQQTHYITVVPDGAGDVVTGAGNAKFTITSAISGADDVAVALLVGDAARDIVRKAVAAINLDANITPYMVAYAVGINLYLRMIEALGNDGTMEIAYDDNGSVGAGTVAAGTAGVAGVAEAAVAQVTNISGPGLAVDTEDVTTHDQATAWEETVATIIRSGEVSLDLVFDPVDATHDAATGLLYRFEDKIYSFLKLIFPDAATTEWEFSGYITGFEPAAPSGGALTATAKAKITSQPLLA